MDKRFVLETMDGEVKVSLNDYNYLIEGLVNKEALIREKEQLIKDYEYNYIALDDILKAIKISDNGSISVNSTLLAKILFGSEIKRLF